MSIRRIFVKDNDNPTWLGWLSMLAVAVLGATLMLASGCVNCYVRCPGTDVRVERVYQSTIMSTAIPYLVAFPQEIGATGDGGLMWENVFTVPIGCLFLVDVACEAAIDTVCLPVDWPLSASRARGKR